MGGSIISTLDIASLQRYVFTFLLFYPSCFSFAPPSVAARLFFSRASWNSIGTFASLLSLFLIYAVHLLVGRW